MAADIRHSQEAAQELANIIKDVRDQDVVWDMCTKMVQFKLDKFDGIYDFYR